MTPGTRAATPRRASASAPAGRARKAAGRSGDVVGAAVNAVLLFAIHQWPTWRALPVLDERTPQVLGVVTAAVVASLVANLVHLVARAPWVRPAGDLVTTGVGLIALVRIWQVFPLDLPASPVDWGLLARIVLAVGIVGSVIGMIANVASLVRRVGDTS